MASINELAKIVKKPRETYFAISDPDKWQEVEAKLTVPFPSDYKEFIGYYGAGVIGNFVVVYNPFSPHKPANFFRYMDFSLEIERKFHFLDFPLFPELGGLLPFASTYNGDHLYWLTEGQPDNWKVVVREVKSKNYELYSYGMVDLFLRLIVADLDPKQDTLRNSAIFWRSFSRKAPFYSVSKQFKKSFEFLKERIVEQVQTVGENISKAIFEKILSSQEFEIEEDVIQQELKHWTTISFIEFVGKDEVYFKVKALPKAINPR
jgi:hypothetical protein